MLYKKGSIRYRLPDKPGIKQILINKIDFLETISDDFIIYSDDVILVGNIERKTQLGERIAEVTIWQEIPPQYVLER